MRTLDNIVQSGAYAPAEYHPKPISRIDDCRRVSHRFRLAETRADEEKERLANLMAYGVDPSQMPVKTVEDPPTVRQIDRFDERERLSSIGLDSLGAFQY